MKTYNFLQSKIDKENRSVYIALTALVVLSVAVGRHVDMDRGWDGFWVGFALAIPLLICFWYVKKRIQSSIPFEKGIKFEDDVCGALSDLGYECYRNIKTKKNGDLDVLAIKNDQYFGIELKNWAGRVELFDDTLVRNRNPRLHRDLIIRKVKGRCAEVKDMLYKDKNIFIKPVFIFGYNTAVDIEQKNIIDNVEVIFLERKNLWNFFSTV